MEEKKTLIHAIYVYTNWRERNILQRTSQEKQDLFLLGNVDNEAEYVGILIDVKVRNIPKNLAIGTPRLKPSTAAFCVMRTTLRAGF